MVKDCAIGAWYEDCRVQTEQARDQMETKLLKGQSDELQSPALFTGIGKLQDIIK